MGNRFLSGLLNAFGKQSFESNVDVYTDRRIDVSFVERVLAAVNGLILQRSAGDPDCLHVQEIGAGGKPNPGLIIGASIELMPEFVPRPIANIMDSPGWQLFMYTMEGCHPRMAKVMEIVYQAIADEGNGFVFQTQDQKITYQSKSMRAATGERLGPDIREMPQVQLEWCIPAGKDPQDFMPEVMALWKEVEHRCMPVRYGYTEPVRFGASPDSMNRFYQFLQKNFKIIVFWQSKLPIVGGHFSQAVDDSKWKVLPPRYARYHKLQCSILMSALLSEPEFLGKLDVLFQRTAMLLDAFYASAIVIRYEPWGKGSLPQHIVDNYALQYGPWWQGLPCLPVWLAWYGRSYFPYVKDALSGFPGASTVEGERIFLKIAAQPVNLDELNCIFPALPQELIIREITREVPGGGVASRSYESADFIPPISPGADQLRS